MLQEKELEKSAIKMTETTVVVSGGVVDLAKREKPDKVNRNLPLKDAQSWLGSVQNFALRACFALIL